MLVWLILVLALGLVWPKKNHSLRCGFKSSPGGIRTCDQSINSRPLYR